MLEKTITYADIFGGPNITETFYFNLTKAECIEMEVSETEGWAERLTKIVEKGEPRDILAAFKKIILAAYGQRSEDGKRFIKSAEAAEEFSTSEGFSDILVELATDPEASAAFVKGILPSNFDTTAHGDKPAREIEEVQLPKHPTNMTREELIAAMKEKSAGLVEPRPDLTQEELKRRFLNE